MARITPIMVTTLRLCTELCRNLGMVPNESETLWRSWVNGLQLGNGCCEGMVLTVGPNMPKGGHERPVLLKKSKGNQKIGTN